MGGRVFHLVSCTAKIQEYDTDCCTTHADCRRPISARVQYLVLAGLLAVAAVHGGFVPNRACRI